jgi:hypothetical protein
MRSWRVTFSRRHRIALKIAVVLTSCTASAPLLAGPPDIGGVWNRYPPYADTFSNEPDPPELQLVEPPLREPYLTAWRALQERRAAADAAGEPLPTPSSQCLPEGAPGIMGAHYALQILHNPELNQITVLGEFMSQIRRIYLEEDLPPIEGIAPGYFGHSVARWNGNALEVTTAGIREDVQYADIPHSAEMKIAERLYLKDGDILVDDITIEDPQYLDGPYRFTFMYRREPSSYRIGEYVCDNDHTFIGPDGTLDMHVPEAAQDSGKSPSDTP